MNSDEVLCCDDGALLDPMNIVRVRLFVIENVLDSSSRNSFFKTHLKSFLLQKSQAEAWHTTSRSLGFSKRDSFQNSGGIGIRPKEVKNSSDTWNIFSGV